MKNKFEKVCQRMQMDEFDEACRVLDGILKSMWMDMRGSEKTLNKQSFQNLRQITLAPLIKHMANTRTQMAPHNHVRPWMNRKRP